MSQREGRGLGRGRRGPPAFCPYGMPNRVYTTHRWAPVPVALPHTPSTTSLAPLDPAALIAVAQALEQINDECRKVNHPCPRGLLAALKDASSWVSHWYWRRRVEAENEHLRSVLTEILDENPHVMSDEEASDLDAQFGLNLKRYANDYHYRTNPL